MELNPKHKEFADEYLETGNATQAVKETFGIENDNYAGVKGNRLIRNDKVRAYLENKAEKAAIRIVELSEQEENLPVALGASKDILDRAGLKPVDKQEVVLEDNTQMSYERAKQVIITGERSNQSDSQE